MIAVVSHNEQKRMALAGKLFALALTSNRNGETRIGSNGINKIRFISLIYKGEARLTCRCCIITKF